MASAQSPRTSLLIFHVLHQRTVGTSVCDLHYDVRECSGEPAVFDMVPHYLSSESSELTHHCRLNVQARTGHVLGTEILVEKLVEKVNIKKIIKKVVTFENKL